MVFLTGVPALSVIARMTQRALLLRVAIAFAYALAMLLVATLHRPLAVTPLERALILAAYQMPGDLEVDFCLPGLGEKHRLDTPCDACVLAAAPGLGAVAAPDLSPPPIAPAVVLPRDQTALVAPARQRPHPRGPPRQA